MAGLSGAKSKGNVVSTMLLFSEPPLPCADNLGGGGAGVRQKKKSKRTRKRAKEEEKVQKNKRRKKKQKEQRIKAARVIY